jgi:PS-10 peptidase S37
MKIVLSFLTIIFILFYSVTLVAQVEEKSELHQRLLSIPDISVKSIEPDSNFAEVFEIFITQPLDHLNPTNGSKFCQRIYLRHVDFTKPMIFNNEGYATKSERRTELAKILRCNEMFVEHRYYGESKPAGEDWKYLNTAQAAADHNRIVELFKQIYTGKWVSTGISKGGQTTIFFKYYYPEAVDVWVPYVAPLNFTQEDKRINQFLNTVGTDICRNKIIAFQRALLKNKDSIIPLFEKYNTEHKYTYGLELDQIFDYAVFEYKFSFWQWGRSSCEDIPNSNASPETLFKHLYTTSHFSYLTDESITRLRPFMYQAYTEIGYYNYETEHLNDLLNTVNGKYASSIVLAPREIELKFNEGLMIDINDFIQEYGNNMLYVYGENDTWSATAVDIGDKTNAVKMVKKDGSHKTRIHSFEGVEKEKIYSTLEKWLDIKIDR